MRKVKETTAWGRRPQGEGLQKLLEEFGVTIKDPDAQQKDWGTTWVLSIQGNELPVSEESYIWAHFGAFVQWQIDAIALRNDIALRYREGSQAERDIICEWLKGDPTRVNFPKELPPLKEERVLPKCDPWESEWLDAARKFSKDPAFFGKRRAPELIREAITIIDAEEEKASLSAHLPGEASSGHTRSYL